ncbi:MAG: peptidoglycan-binding protein [Lysobacterales bacterium]
MTRRSPSNGTTAARDGNLTLSLHEGDNGSHVVKLQRRLKKLGFNPGKIDGDFGPATAAALLAFQKSENLLADGIAGPRTLMALGITHKADLPSAIPGVTPRIVTQIFPYTPVDNIKTNLPFVLDALVNVHMEDKPMVLMALATIRAETESFKPVSEGLSRFNTSPGGHPYDLYDNRRDLGNQGAGDGERYKGRGFIQLTGRANYEKYGKALGLGNQLLDNPDLANDPTTAAALLAIFLKDKERSIKEALLENDMRRARRLVNGGSHGLARFSDAYLKGESLIV